MSRYVIVQWVKSVFAGVVLALLPSVCALAQDGAGSEGPESTPAAQVGAAEPPAGRPEPDAAGVTPPPVPSPSEARLPLVSGPPEPLPGFAPGPGAQPDPLPSPEWNPHWRKAGPWDVFVISAGSAFYVAQSLVELGGSRAQWEGPILWDDDVRDALRMETSGGRRTTGTISDLMMIGSLVHNAVFDNLVVAWAIHGNGELAAQMSLMNAEAYAIALTLTSVAKAVSGRARPMVAECEADPRYSPDCQSLNRYRSFFSGHSAVTAVGAGLLCAHHINLPLYDGGLADYGTCGVGIALTLATGALRIASDNHWASDVAVGHLVGFASGFLVPTLLYYRGNGPRSRPTVARGESPARQAPTGHTVVLPALGPTQLGLQARGTF